MKQLQQTIPLRLLPKEKREYSKLYGAGIKSPILERFLPQSGSNKKLEELYAPHLGAPISGR